MQLGFHPQQKLLVFTGERAEYLGLAQWLATAEDGEVYLGNQTTGPPDQPLTAISAGTGLPSERVATLNKKARTLLAAKLAEVLEYNDEADFAASEWHSHLDLSDDDVRVELPSGRAAEILIAGPSSL
jgi:hypothetical protein